MMREELLREALGAWGHHPSRWTASTEGERRAWLGDQPFAFEAFEHDAAALAVERLRADLDDLDADVAREAANELEGLGYAAPAEHLDWSFGEDERRVA